MKTPSAIELLKEKIYKRFSAMKAGETVRVSELLKSLDFGEIRVRRKCVKFSSSSMKKLVIFIRLRGIKSQTKAIEYLKANRGDALSLGFGRGVPDQRSLSYFLNNSLSKEANHLVYNVCTCIEDAAEKSGIILEECTVSPGKFKKSRNRKTFYNRKIEKLQEACKFMKRHMYPHIELGIGRNAKFGKRRQLDILLKTGVVNQFLENKSNTIREEFEMGKTSAEFPLADTVFYHIKKYGKGEKAIESLKAMYTEVFERVWKIAKGTNKFNGRRFKVALDFTPWRFYGNKSTYMVKGCKPDAGTSYCFMFATICIVEPGMRFTFLALPVGNFCSKKKTVEELLEFTEKKIKIDRIYLDRGFFGIEVINLLKSRGIKFVMPAIKDNKIKKISETVPAPFILNKYVRGRRPNCAEFNLFFVKGKASVKEGRRIVEKDIAMPFATNMEINGEDIEFAEMLAKDYRKRWGIETSYRDLKDDFRPRTVARDYTVRLFYFLFAVIFYNIWILVKILVSISLFFRIVSESIITGKMFADILFCTDLKKE